MRNEKTKQRGGDDLIEESIQNAQMRVRIGGENVRCGSSSIHLMLALIKGVNSV